MILGCDPGLGGAFALYDDLSVLIEPMPTYDVLRNNRARRVLDDYGVARVLRRMRLEGARTLAIEDVHGAPGQSAPAAFTFGYGYGVVIAAAIAFEYQIERIRPETWKRALRVPADKGAARQRASELMPACAGMWPRAGDHGRAEAALIALYAHRYLDG